ncbi:Triosephosphate isomerase [Dissulfuribacter thermophilus]|uniref:Triosephosphate isomerase n=1 Tax=Dissulfuribacter thermophilus TaxID=1156395 RepID=A0A1B9F3Q7_9BACT|nr:triose-phosphate isomerase [Dissulfuribacter thermophilus]OCC14560.1 Triosephosphate isomerase [Dissulfuribacter thermophilus]
MNGRRPLIAANWKMYKTLEETRAFFKEFIPKIKDIFDRDIIIAPPFTSLNEAANLVKEVPNCHIAAQNMHFEEQGAFTGEISPLMLKAIGVSFVIIGHSERRHIFGESDDLIGKKVKSAITHGICPILCVGETLEQREQGHTNEVISTQIDGGLSLVSLEEMESVTIAYEPVWAIGTGKTATPELAQEVHSFIRKLIAQKFNSPIAENLRLLYGGSVKPENVAGLMNQPDIDGALVGGASLEVNSFEKIVRFES